MSRKTEVVEVWGGTSALLQSIAALMKKHVGMEFHVSIPMRRALGLDAL